MIGTQVRWRRWPAARTRVARRAVLSANSDRRGVRVAALAALSLILLGSSAGAQNRRPPPGGAAVATAPAPATPPVTPQAAPAGAPRTSSTAATVAANWEGGYELVLRYLLPAFIGFFAVVTGVWFTRRNLISDHWLRTNALEIERIQVRLDRLWGPYLLSSDANHLFAQDIRSRQPVPSAYRMLPSLFDEQWRGSLSIGDRQLVRDVCETGERLSTMIVENSGMVDFKLLPFLSRALVHWRVLKLAAEGELGDDPQTYLRYVYPRALDEAVRREVVRLIKRLNLLRSAPSEYHGPMKSLDLTDLKLDPWPDPSRPKFVEGQGLVPDPAALKSLWDSLDELTDVQASPKPRWWRTGR